MGWHVLGPHGSAVSDLAASKVILLAPFLTVLLSTRGLRTCQPQLSCSLFFLVLSSQNTGCVFSKSTHRLPSARLSLDVLVSPHQGDPFPLKGTSGRAPKESSRFWNGGAWAFPTSLSRFGHSSHQHGRSQLHDITSECRGSSKSTTCRARRRSFLHSPI